jgi:hypothetical protein
MMVDYIGSIGKSKIPCQLPRQTPDHCIAASMLLYNAWLFITENYAMCLNNCIFTILYCVSFRRCWPIA